MARLCELTGRKTTAGKSRTHRRGKAGGVSGRWSKKAPVSNRTFRPNIIKNVKLNIDGVDQKVDVSAKVLKRIKNYGSFQGITLA